MPRLSAQSIAVEPTAVPPTYARRSLFRPNSRRTARSTRRSANRPIDPPAQPARKSPFVNKTLRSGGRLHPHRGERLQMRPNLGIRAQDRRLKFPKVLNDGIGALRIVADAACLQRQIKAPNPLGDIRSRSMTRRSSLCRIGSRARAALIMCTRSSCVRVRPRLSPRGN